MCLQKTLCQDAEVQQRGKLKWRVCVQKLCGHSFPKYGMYKRACQTVNSEKWPTDNTLQNALWAKCKALWVKPTIVTLQLIGESQLALIHEPRRQSVRYLRTSTKVNKVKIEKYVCHTHQSTHVPKTEFVHMDSGIHFQKKKTNILKHFSQWC